MKMQDMTPEQEMELENIFKEWDRYGRYVDYTNETMEAGGPWRGGTEHISFGMLFKAVSYLQSIGVRCE